MHSQQPSCVVDRKFSVRTRFDMEMGRATGFFVEKIKSGCEWALGTRERLRRDRSAD